MKPNFKHYDQDLESKNKRRSAQTSPVKNVVEDLIKKYELEDKFEELSIVEAWEKIASPIILRRTRSIFIKDQSLFLKLESSPLKNELLMRKTELLEQLNRALGGSDQINTLIFL